MRTDIPRPPNRTGGIVTPAHSKSSNNERLPERVPEINTSVFQTWVHGASWWLAQYERTQNPKYLTAFHRHIDGIWRRIGYARPQ